MKLFNLFAASTLLAFTACETGYYSNPPVSSHPGQHGSQPPVVVRAPNPPPPPRDHQPRRETWVDVSISAPERQVIQGYVAGTKIEQQHPRKGKKPKSLPPGLQKKLDRGEALPPGWDNKFRKGEVLPVEVYEQCHRLPDEVIVRLPPQPPGTVLISIGGKVGRILAATREILDVFEVEY